eukprot:TRINITY_DN4873_c0_g1_i1.p1 TRINITY_DN4873_c0_g1~~TRINITY_DN4873_c0_g1_i1.p1  ORF type:complete len:401 (+),score=207.61 TRINITY_DN4873_c0_g1_i1:138-1340(+)
MAAGEGETVVESPPVVNGTDVPVETKKDLIEAPVTEEEKKDAEKATTPVEEAPKKGKKPSPPSSSSVHKKDFESDKVYLYQFNRSMNVPSISPYCFKVESWLKLNNIKYENVDHKSKLRSRKGLLPFVELNGEEISDSDIIIKTLGKKFEKDLDEGLTQEQKNVQHAMLTMVDNHLLWLVSQWRTRHMDHLVKGYKMNLQSLSGFKFPNPLISFYLKHTYIRKAIRKVKATGLGEYSNEELDTMGKNDLKVLSDLLGEKQFFFGDEPHSLDLNAFVQLAMLLCVEKEVVECPLRDYLEAECTNLVGLFNRMKDRAWGDHWEMAIGESCDLNPHIPKPEPPAPEEKPAAEAPTKEETPAAEAADKKEEEKEKADNEKEKEDEAKEKDENKSDENKESEEKK